MNDNEAIVACCAIICVAIVICFGLWSRRHDQ